MNKQNKSLYMHYVYVPFFRDAAIALYSAIFLLLNSQKLCLFRLLFLCTNKIVIVSIIYLSHCQYHIPEVSTSQETMKAGCG